MKAEDALKAGADALVPAPIDIRYFESILLGLLKKPD